MNFTAIDFETAQGNRNSICQVGLIRVEGNVVVKEITQLIKPPGNKYNTFNTLIHGINGEITQNSPTFDQFWPEIKHYIHDQKIVAHNMAFDAECLIKTLEYYNIEIPCAEPFCTYQYTGYSLINACQGYGIELTKHHEALFDALACTYIYLKIINEEPFDDSKITEARQSLQSYFTHEKLKGDIFKKDLTGCNENNPFYNKKVVLTGVMKSISRGEAAEILKKLGADIDSSVTRRTDFIISGADAGPLKIRKAELYNNEGSNIQIINEEQFKLMTL